MFTVTEAAKEKILQRMQEEGKTGRTLRVAIAGWTADEFQYRLEVIPEDRVEPGDERVSSGELPVVLAKDSADRMRGGTLDFVETAHERGFSIDNPNPVFTDEMELRVQRILDEQINPGVGMHGGRVSLLGVENGTAYIEFAGGCVGCGMSQVTMKQGVDKAIKENVPEIREVVDSTDHAEGTNPYYDPEEVEGAASPVA